MQRQFYAQLRTWAGDDIDELARLLSRLTAGVLMPADGDEAASSANEA